MKLQKYSLLAHQTHTHGRAPSLQLPQLMYYLNNMGCGRSTGYINVCNINKFLMPLWYWKRG